MVCVLFCSYVWKKDGNEIRFDEFSDLALEPGTGNLLISNCQNRHQGVYQCIGRNDFGLTISPGFFLGKAGE